MWGVRLERVGDAIVVAPSGTLEGPQVDRLRRVLLSRENTGCLALDLRELGGIGPDGVDFLHELRARADAGQHELALVVDAESRAWVEGIGIGDLELEEDLEALLARRRS